MDLLQANGVILNKTLDLCAALTSLPAFKAARSHIDAFLADEQAKQQYQLVAEKGEYLNHKQQQGLQLTSEEIAEFERNRTALVDNPIAREFLAAQEEMHELQHSIQKYLNKTIELGRVPSEDDFESCGSGCSCHH